MFHLPFQIKDTNVQSLLATARFVIPSLQRPYAWTAAQARDLLNDLEPMFDASDEGDSIPFHFFGMIVSLDSGGNYQVIDGQQRLTTLTTLLALVRNSLLNLENHCRTKAATAHADEKANLTQVALASENLAQTLHNLLWVNLGFQEQAEIQYEARLRVSPEIASTYGALLNNTPFDEIEESGQPSRHLLEIARVLQDDLITPSNYKNLAPLKQYKYLSQVFKIVGEGLIVVHMTTAGASSGYDLFESLNATGVSLNELDLIKVWMLSTFAEFNTNDKEIAEKMRSLTNDDSTRQREFFRDFCILRSTLNGHDGFAQFRTNKNDASKDEKQLSMKARKLVFKDEAAGGVGGNQPLVWRIENEVDEMMKLSPHWESLRGLKASGDRTPDSFLQCQHHMQIRSSLGHLLEVLRFQQGYPHLMHWAEMCEGDPGLFADLISSFERFFFRFRTICGNSESRVRSALTKVTNAVSAKSGASKSSLQALFKTLVEDGADDKTFASLLPEKLGYGSGQKNLRTKYFFYQVALANWPPPFIGDAGFHIVTDTHPNGAAWTLEHIFPQNADDGSLTSITEEEIDSLGNLCLLNPTINSSLSNKSFAEKRIKAASLKSDGKTIMVPDSASIFYSDSSTSWGSSEILKREKFLVDTALKVFGF